MAILGYRIDPVSDAGYVDEFRCNPIGHHGPGLMRVLNAMRRSPDGRQLVLLAQVPLRRWVIAWLPADRADSVEIEHDRVFDSREEAEWFVFCRRWEAMTGQKIGNL